MSEGQVLPHADLTAKTAEGMGKGGSSGRQNNALEGKPGVWVHRVFGKPGIGCLENIYIERKLYSFCLCYATLLFPYVLQGCS